jgi:hypothetical protein
MSRELTDAYRQVVAFAHQIDATVIQIELDLQLRVRDQELGDRRRQVHQPERHRGRHPELALELALQAARYVFRLRDIGQDAPRPLVIGVACFGQAGGG